MHVILVDTIGSSPQDAGSKILVTESGLHSGTVGGGKVEAQAIRTAQEMLADNSLPATRFEEWNLQKDIGMTCGGTNKFFFERKDPAAWQIVIFGAGHIAQSLTRLLLQMPCRVTCIDPRQNWLDKLPEAAQLQKICLSEPASQVEQLPDDAYVLCMTQGHASDFPVLREILKTDRNFPYLGVIGSKAKAATSRKELQEAGISAERAQDFHCPIGLAIGSNHPMEIAISITAQLLQVRDRS